MRGLNIERFISVFISNNKVDINIMLLLVVFVILVIIIKNRLSTHTIKICKNMPNTKSRSVCIKSYTPKARRSQGLLTERWNYFYKSPSQILVVVFLFLFWLSSSSSSLSLFLLFLLLLLLLLFFFFLLLLLWVFYFFDDWSFTNSFLVDVVVP
jgi:hypothetical protein